jgi:cobalt/nickel transport system ATP-binding protein
MPSRGQVEVNGLTLTSKSLPTIRQQVGLVFQSADDQLFMPTVEEDVAFGPANMHLSREEIDQRVERSLREVGALDLRQRSTHQLSEGEKRRVAIATVLAMEPSILVMDEPSAGLDPRARRQIIDLLNHFEHTALIATHDLDLARQICPRTVVMHAGRVAADGPTAQVLDDEPLLEHCGL